MQELLHAIAQPLNLPYTVLLGLVLLYWISVILGALDLSAFDFDVDADVDVDVDIDVDADLDVDTEVGGVGGWFAALLHFFNFGKVPFMLIMTVVVLTGWTLTILSNHYWGDHAPGFALAMAGPILFLSLLIAKFLTTPLVPVFESMNQEAAPVDFIGQTGQLLLPASPDKFGQAEVMIRGDVLLVNVKTLPGGPVLPRGTLVVITGRTEDRRYYLIEPTEE